MDKRYVFLTKSLWKEKVSIAKENLQKITTFE